MSRSQNYFIELDMNEVEFLGASAALTKSALAQDANDVAECIECIVQLLVEDPTVMNRVRDKMLSVMKESLKDLDKKIADRRQQL